MLITTLAASVIADVSSGGDGPDSAFTGNVVLVVVLVGGQLLSLLIAGLGLWMSSRRNPPIAEEAYKTFVPRSEYDEGVQRLHGRIDHALSEVAAARQQASQAFGDLERGIGRLEGMAAALEKSINRSSR